MKIFLAGSTGRVATEVLKLLSAQGKEVIAGARRPAAVEKLPHVTTVKLDLHAPVDKLTERGGCHYLCRWFTGQGFATDGCLWSG